MFRKVLIAGSASYQFINFHMASYTLPDSQPALVAADGCILSGAEDQTLIYARHTQKI